MTVHYDDGTVRILHGDARELLHGLHADVIVTDPPYGLEFMGVAWDTFSEGPKGGPRPRNEWGDFGSREHPRTAQAAGRIQRNKGRALQQFTEQWATLAYDALPPGGWLLAFGGTRTSHRLASGLEDAGFELRDTIMWMYGSGFPKSKASLKPGYEPVIVARRPGSGVLQIDAARIAGQPEAPGTTPSTTNGNGTTHGAMKRTSYEVPAGRWPPNVALTHGPGCQPVGTRKVRSNGQGQEDHAGEWRGADLTGSVDGTLNRQRSNGYADPDGTETVQAWDCEPDCPVALLDQQSGERRASGHRNRSDQNGPHNGMGMLGFSGRSFAIPGVNTYADQGGASRFYFTAKASRAERVTVDGEKFPCVKPLALMRWLVRLVTPPGGLVLDPFCGSGSTLVAAALEGFRAVGIEADERWCRGSAKRVAERPPVQEVLALD